MRTRDILSAINNVKKAKVKIEEMNKRYPKKYKEELEMIGDDVITQWYSTYDPIFYNRSGDLYDAFRVNLDGVNYRVDFDSSLMDGNEYIFENSFMKGYHGGAISGDGHPNPGIPYWRTPHPWYYEWGRPAFRSFSPYNRMINLMNKKIRKLDKEKQDEFDKIIEKVNNSINKLI